MGEARNILSVEDASEIVLRVAERLLSVTVPLHLAAQDATAPDLHPPYPASVKVSLLYQDYKS